MLISDDFRDWVRVCVISQIALLILQDLKEAMRSVSAAQLYRRCDDGLEIVVKLFGEFDRDEGCEIEKWMNLTHPCIAAPFGFVLPTASKELKIVRLYSRSGSLKDVLSARPLWWTPTAKAIAGIVLGMKFLHSFELIHGGLKPNNALFDEYHRIQIADFGWNRLNLGENAAIARGLGQSLSLLKCGPVKSTLRKSMYPHLH
jgi:serine/threonine protein kinase